MNKRRKGGTVLLDFLGTGLIAGSAMVGIFLSTFLSTAYLLQKTELYFLARSRMYGNTNDCVGREGLWPTFEGFEITFNCDGSKLVSEMSVFGNAYSRQSLELERNR